MDKLISINKNVEIVAGYKFAVAYNSDTLSIYEFDKNIGELLVDILPLSEDEIINIAEKKGIIKCDEEPSLTAMLGDMVEKDILNRGQGVLASTDKNLSNNTTTTLVLEVLTQCSFHCRHCYLGDRLFSHDRLEMPLLRRILNEAKSMGANRVQITGGNPSLHPDIVDIIGLIRSASLEIIYFSNGIKLTDEILTALRKADAALHMSIYGMSNESGGFLTGHKDYYDDIRKALDLIKRYGVRIRSLDFMAVEENIHEIGLFAEFCKQEKYPYRFDSPAAVGNAQINKIRDMKKRLIDVELGFEMTEMLEQLRLQSCEFDQPTILANGDVTFCILSNQNFSDLILGNIYKSSLREIWFSEKTRRLFDQADVNKHEVCRRCEYKYLCGGICPFSRKFHEVNLTRQGIPDCPRYQDKKFRTWMVKC